MPSTQELSVDELREESERSREALTSTIGELRDTVGNTAMELRNSRIANTYQKRN